MSLKLVAEESMALGGSVDSGDNGERVGENGDGERERDRGDWAML